MMKPKRNELRIFLPESKMWQNSLCSSSFDHSLNKIIKKNIHEETGKSTIFYKIIIIIIVKNIISCRCCCSNSSSKRQKVLSTTKKIIQLPLTCFFNHYFSYNCLLLWVRAPKYKSRLQNTENKHITNTLKTKYNYSHEVTSYVICQHHKQKKKEIQETWYNRIIACIILAECSLNLRHVRT